jgi:hypothetical protein
VRRWLRDKLAAGIRRVSHNLAEATLLLDHPIVAIPVDVHFILTVEAPNAGDYWRRPLPAPSSSTKIPRRTSTHKPPDELPAVPLPTVPLPTGPPDDHIVVVPPGWSRGHATHLPPSTEAGMPPSGTTEARMQPSTGARMPPPATVPGPVPVQDIFPRAQGNQSHVVQGRTPIFPREGDVAPATYVPVGTARQRRAWTHLFGAFRISEGSATPLRLQHSIEFSLFYLFYLLLFLSRLIKKKGEMAGRALLTLLRLPTSNLRLDLANQLRNPRRSWPSQSSLSHPFRCAKFFTTVFGLTPSEFHRFLAVLGPMPPVLCFRARVKVGRLRKSDGAYPLVASNEYVPTVDGFLLLFFFMRCTESGFHLASHFFDHDETTLLNTLCMFIDIMFPFAQYMVSAPEVLRRYLTRERLLHFRDSIRRWAGGNSTLNFVGFLDGTCRAVLRPYGVARVYWSVFHDMYGVTFFVFTMPDGIKLLIGPMLGYDSDCGILAKCPWNEVFESIWAEVFPSAEYSVAPSFFGDGIFPGGEHRWLTSSQGMPPAVSGAFGFLRAPNEHEIGLMNSQWQRLKEKRSIRIQLSTHRLYVVGAFLSNVLNLGSNYTLGIRRRFMEEMTAIERGALGTTETQITEYLGYGSDFIQNDDAVGSMMKKHQENDMQRFNMDADGDGDDNEEPHVFAGAEMPVERQEQGKLD